MDIKLFYWINQGHRNAFFDLIMPVISEFGHWRIYFLIAWLLLFFLGGRKLKITLTLLAVLVGVLDYTNSFFFKPLFNRIRPCNVLSQVHTFWACPKSLSFPSNHAANTFGAAFLLSFVYRRWTPLLISVPVVVGYSRVYVGEHYPLDILGGAALGAVGAFSAAMVWKWAMTTIGSSKVEEAASRES